MLERVKELIHRPYIYKISFTYESYGSTLVSCVVKRPYHKSLGIYGIAGDDEEALTIALSRLDEVKELEEKLGGNIYSPPLDKQQYIGGYYRKILFEDYEVEFKRTHDSYDISNIKRRDEHGFYYTNRKLDDEFFKSDKKEFFNIDTTEFDELLKEGEELYYWDNIQGLAGSAGVAIVKDGRIIKMKGLARA